MPDLKIYCTQFFYDSYQKNGHLIGCSPKTRNKLLSENRKHHKDLNIRLSIDRRKHDIRKIDAEWLHGRPPVGDWYQIRIEGRKL